MTPPSLLENLRQSRGIRAEGVYRPRVIHYHYLKNTKECTELHYASLADPVGLLAGHLFFHASNQWDGETLALKVVLIEAMDNWETHFTGGGRGRHTVSSRV